ncbi:Flagellar filament outer layer protein Flaa [Alkalispirochaeta americana]|uniref:Flagellar filament outer layer protein Flaa n=1 Tax=Alkalispirochaeta americana TaxID=159291 RepID=A0A1N6WES8_9SPIO|nr:flagellar filament outer layer protein FlaA [Alkalispirochaeta americana]SIQ88485.1 Flagellar filament outer layer protein Flaa [Alkalispirochaeta americana]
MKKTKLLVGVMLCGLVWAVTAQETLPDPAGIGVDAAQQNLQEISIDRFEDPGFWIPSVAADVGVVMHRRVAGGPADKEPIPGEVEAGIEVVDDYVIGVRTDFYRRGAATVSLRPVRPLAVPGIVKTLSVWVVGRNFNHELSIVIEDYFGNVNVLPMGRLNFSGWKQLTVAVPPSVVQRNPHYNTETGIRIRGLVVNTFIPETYGSYYVYFDDLRAVTDLFAEESRDPDDMIDNW